MAYRWALIKLAIIAILICAGIGWVFRSINEKPKLYVAYTNLTYMRRLFLATAEKGNAEGGDLATISGDELRQSMREMPLFARITKIRKRDFYYSIKKDDGSYVEIGIQNVALPNDPFNHEGPERWRFHSTARRPHQIRSFEGSAISRIVFHDFIMFYSYGPDRRDDVTTIDPSIFRGSRITINDVKRLLNPVMYDPTNGMTSTGDICAFAEVEELRMRDGTTTGGEHQ